MDDLKPDDLELKNLLIQQFQVLDEQGDPHTNECDNYDGNASSSSNSSESIHNEFPLSNLSLEEQISIFRSKIQQLEISNTDLRNELNYYKNEALNKNGIQSGLKTRIGEQDNTILEMKNEQLNLQLSNQNLLKEKDDFKDQVDACLSQINQLKTELSSKDATIERIKFEMREMLREKNEQKQLVRQQVKHVTETLEIAQEKGNAISGMIANADRKLSILNNNLASHPNKKDMTCLTNLNQKNHHLIISQEEFSVLKDSLLKLRQQFSSNHPSQLLINIIEQNFVNIVERSNSLNPISSISASSNSTSGSSSLTSSSANSPVQPIAQSQSPSSMSSVHSSTSSISSIAFSHKNNPLVDAKDTEKQQNELPAVSNESNVKKIISRLLSQTHMVPPGQINQQSAVSNNANKNENISKNKISHVWENCINGKTPVSTLLTISSACTTSTTSTSSTTVSSNYSTTELTQNQTSFTKCVYYVDKNVTPFMTTIFKK